MRAGIYNIMKLFVCSIKQTKRPTLIDANAHIFQVKALLGGGVSLWEDDDPSIPLTEEAVRAHYLTPNNIPVLKIGQFPNEPAAFWAIVDNATINFDSFYTYEEAAADGTLKEDPTALCWKSYYVFLNANTGEDLVGSFDYLGECSAPVKHILQHIIESPLAASKV
jgi:hypothetical protein